MYSVELHPGNVEEFLFGRIAGLRQGVQPEVLLHAVDGCGNIAILDKHPEKCGVAIGRYSDHEVTGRNLALVGRVHEQVRRAF